MNERLGYSRDGEFVTLRMSVWDYKLLLLALGFAAEGLPHSARALANRLNAGRPASEWTPYEIPEAAAR